MTISIQLPVPAIAELRAMLSSDLQSTEADALREGGDDGAACEEVAAMMRDLLRRLVDTGALVVDDDARQYVGECLLADGLLQQPGNRATWGAALDALDAAESPKHLARLTGP